MRILRVSRIITEVIELVVPDEITEDQCNSIANDMDIVDRPEVTDTSEYFKITYELEEPTNE